MGWIESHGRRVPCRLIIFDKDGTLIDFTSTWVPLIRKRISSLLRRLKRDGDLEAYLLRFWGIDPTTGRVDPRGPCPVSSRSDEIVIASLALYQAGYPWDESKEWVLQAFDEADADGDWRQQVVPIEGILEFLTQLKINGFHTALATNDERKDTEAILHHLGLEALFDVILCWGEVHPPKPHPETIHTICRKLSVSAEEAVMVGDSVTDMMMGKRAGVGLTIGILEGGVTPRDMLESWADLVLQSIRELRISKG